MRHFTRYLTLLAVDLEGVNAREQSATMLSSEPGFCTFDLGIPDGL